jgi:hypothetical protein
MGNNTSTSKFGNTERSILKIDENIVSTLSNIGIICTPIDNIMTPKLFNITNQLQDLNDDFFIKRWIKFDQRNTLLNETYHFCECLHRILINKINHNTQIQAENLVKTLGDKIFTYAQYDQIPLMKTNDILQFTYNNIKFSGDSDGVVENLEKQILCIIREDKHDKTNTYEGGNLQLASNIILAYIYNYKFFNVRPNSIRKIVGIKLISDNVEFMTVNFSDNYIIQLVNQQHLIERANVNIYKAGSLANTKDRKHIFECFEAVRQHFIK